MNSLASVYCLAHLWGIAQANLGTFSLNSTLLLWSNGCSEALIFSACGLRLDMSPKVLNHIQVSLHKTHTDSPSLTILTTLTSPTVALLFLLMPSLFDSPPVLKDVHSNSLVALFIPYQ